MSYNSVAVKYHTVWLQCMQSNQAELTALEKFPSKIPAGELCQPFAPGVANTSEAYLDYIFQVFSQKLPQFESLLGQLCKETGLIVQIAPQKLRSRVWQKSFFDYNGNYSRVVDIVRGSGVAAQLSNVVSAMEWILKNCDVRRFKNRFCDARKDIMARGGYRDVLINIAIDQFLFEIQIHYAPLYNMKEASHKVLEIARAVIEPTIFKLAILDRQDNHEKHVTRIRDLERDNASAQAQILALQEELRLLHLRLSTPGPPSLPKVPPPPAQVSSECKADLPTATSATPTSGEPLPRWSSLSTKEEDEGNVQGERVTCPHCGKKCSERSRHIFKCKSRHEEGAATTSEHRKPSRSGSKERKKRDGDERAAKHGEEGKERAKHDESQRKPHHKDGGRKGGH